jgi:ketosteroid isomerase-like protein
MAEAGSEERGTLGGVVDRAKAAMGRGDGQDEMEGRVATVREALSAFGDGDHDRFLAAFNDEAEWVAPEGERFPGSGSHRGPRAIREHFVGGIERSFSSFGFRPDHYLEAEREGWVIALGAFFGEGGKGGGFEAPGAQVWEFEGDRIARVRIFTDSAAFPAPRSEEEPPPPREEEGEDEREAGEEDHSQEEGGAGAEASSQRAEDSSDEEAERQSEDR